MHDSCKHGISILVMGAAALGGYWTSSISTLFLQLSDRGYHGLKLCF